MAPIFSMKCPMTMFCAGAGTVLAITVISKYFLDEKDGKENFVSDYIPDELAKGDHGLKAELIAACSAARIAGENMLGELKKVKRGVQTKYNSIDFATETDRANEKMIFKVLREHFEAHNFIGEESSAELGDVIPPLGDDPTWIVDPIDGTTNFVHSFPLSCVSIGLCKKKIPVMGVIFCPATSEMFIAVKGHGAFLNGERIHVSSCEVMKDALVLTEFGYSRMESDIDIWFKAAKDVLMTGAHGLRAMGSGVMDLCFLAAGRLDAVYAGVAGEGWKPWDYCAGQVMIEEAGGVICDISGGTFDLYGKTILAASCNKLADELVNCLHPVEPIPEPKDDIIIKIENQTTTITEEHNEQNIEMTLTTDQPHTMTKEMKNVEIGSEGIVPSVTKSGSDQSETVKDHNKSRTNNSANTDVQMGKAPSPKRNDKGKSPRRKGRGNQKKVKSNNSDKINNTTQANETSN
jgi:fructose-1,6-bisphosphatase/inositol monophosphatase family enzyme